MVPPSLSVPLALRVVAARADGPGTFRHPERSGAPGARSRPETANVSSDRTPSRIPISGVAAKPGAFVADDTGCIAERSAIDVGGQRWERLLVRTHVIRPGEDIVEVVARYARPYARPGDLAFVGQKAVSIAQGRLVQERTVRPRPLAVFLSRHVKRTPFGRGLGRPATMEIALREAGTPRILLAAVVHLLGRPLGRSGDFYRVAGRRVASIDGVTDWALPPFNQYIVLHPTDAGGLARSLAARLGIPVAIVDLNDLGGEVLGYSPGIDPQLLGRILADNPLGQGPFRTPLGLARPL